MLELAQRAGKINQASDSYLYIECVVEIMSQSDPHTRLIDNPQKSTAGPVRVCFLPASSRRLVSSPVCGEMCGGEMCVSEGVHKP